MGRQDKGVPCLLLGSRGLNIWGSSAPSHHFIPETVFMFPWFIQVSVSAGPQTPPPHVSRLSRSFSEDAFKGVQSKQLWQENLCAFLPWARRFAQQRSCFLSFNFITNYFK